MEDQDNKVHFLPKTSFAATATPSDFRPQTDPVRLEKNRLMREKARRNLEAQKVLDELHKILPPKETE